MEVNFFFLLTLHFWGALHLKTNLMNCIDCATALYFRYYFKNRRLAETNENQQKSRIFSGDIGK